MRENIEFQGQIYDVEYRYEIATYNTVEYGEHIARDLEYKEIVIIDGLYPICYDSGFVEELQEFINR